MDPVDVLTFAVTAAQYIRSSADPEQLLARAFRQVGVENPDPGPLAVRIAALIDAAGADHRRDVMDFLSTNAGPLPLNRPLADADVELNEADPEAERLAEYASEHEDDGRPMLGAGFSSFNVADRSAACYFGARTVVVRDGKRLTEEEAGEIEEGDQVESEYEELPATVRCLLDYPLEVPVLFTIETGTTPWNVWDICCAIADQYARVYEQAGRHGVWGHDVTDLVVEELLYFPGERLVYPLIGS